MAFEEVILFGGISLGTVLAIAKLSFAIWKERKKLKAQIRALGMQFNDASKKLVKHMNRMLKDWLKLLKLKFSSNQAEIFETLEVAFKTFINDPNVEVRTSDFIAAINGAFNSFKSDITNKCKNKS